MELIIPLPFTFSVSNFPFHLGCSYWRLIWVTGIQIGTVTSALLDSPDTGSLAFPVLSTLSHSRDAQGLGV